MYWIGVVEWLARVILILLCGLSVWSISIIIERRRFFKNISLPTRELGDLIKSKKEINHSQHFLSDFFQEIKNLKTHEQVDRAFEAFAQNQRKDLEKGLPVLATLGSTSPFVGLLGTILGIIVSFGELSQGAGSSNSVMYSLAEALILTAVGLIVAIPAVVAFNYFNRKARSLLTDAQSLKDIFLAYRE
jgi:biopolymer transport protein ExbB